MASATLLRSEAAVNNDAPNPEHLSDHPEETFGRKKRHLAGMAFGFLTPLLMLCFALERHVGSDVLFFVVLASIPMIFVGFRSWRRWFHPDLLPIRWADDSVTYKRVKVAELVVAGVNLVAWLAVGLTTLAQEASRHKFHLAWLAVMLSASIRVILMQFREDRQPLSPPVPLPSISPYDSSLRLTNSIRPVYSKDWDR